MSRTPLFACTIRQFQIALAECRLGLTVDAWQGDMLAETRRAGFPPDEIIRSDPPDENAMDSDNASPYAPPKSQLTSADPHGAAVLRFPRIRTLAVIALTIVTLSFYLPYWLYTRSAILNDVQERPVSRTFIAVAVLVYLASFAMIVPESLYPDNPDIILVSSASSLVSNIIMLVWVFGFRNRLNEMTGTTRGSKFWLGPVLTFFFQVFYLQYKINQLIDAEQDAAPGETARMTGGAGPSSGEPGG